MFNMLSAKEHPQNTLRLLQATWKKSKKNDRIISVGDVARAAELGIHCSPFGVIPNYKKHKPNKWRLIVDLSTPTGHSINDGISKELASLSYVLVDDVVACALKEGKGALLAKMDVKQAYRNIPVHSSDRAGLGMSWEGRVYIDSVLPFGLRSAPLLFSAVTDALQWIMKIKGVRLLFHYIDDFITIGAPQSEECAHNVAIMNTVCDETGIPIEPEKTKGPATSITFLGIEIDTVALEICLPHDKLSVLKSTLQTWRGRKACRKRELLSLIGTMLHASKAVRAGRTFLRRLIDLSTVVKHLDHFVRLSLSARADLEWWYRYSTSWNGVSMMLAVNKANPQVILTSDASGSWGCGAFAGSEWFQLKWAGHITSSHIAVKEMVPIVIAAAVWGPQWKGKTVMAQCDNSAVVTIISNGTSRDQDIMHLMRCLAFIAAKFEFNIWAQHIKGVDNTLADALSRNDLPLFISLHSQASQLPTTIPAPLLNLLIVSRPNWTSQYWTELWTTIFKTD